MIDYKQDHQKRKNLIHFIKCTQELLETDGINDISIRKIASHSCYHNSTLYLYFSDLDELIMLASIVYFQKYSEDLEQLSIRLTNNKADSYESFYTISKCFGQSAFRYPEIFYNFFFGKHSNDLFPYLNTYYDLFPEEKNQYSRDIEAMYFGKNYTERCMKTLIPLIGDSRTHISEKNVHLINDLSVSYFRQLLWDRCHDSTLSSDVLLDKFLESLHFLVDKDF